MPWLNPTQYDPNDICKFCQSKLGTTEAIYQTPCNHNFHNDCFAEYCEMHNGNINCPTCHINLGSDFDYNPCLETLNFKEHNLARPDGMPVFTDKHVLAMYNRIPPELQQPMPVKPGLYKLGGRKRRTRRNKNKINKRNKRGYKSKRK
jgi:hypothetical protein